MKKLLSSFTFLLSMSCAMAENNVIWPNLAQIKFISGRAASEKDVSEGSAVFVLKTGETITGQALPVLIPQYAYLVDGETKTRTPCVLIQAEESNGQQVGGCVSAIDGSMLVGLIKEFELHGKNIPK
jgi:hypothetical protein